MFRKLFFFFSIFLFLNYTGTAQTRLIAYLSHSGDLSYFEPTSEDNFGLPDYPPTLDSIAKINDSTIVHYYNPFYGNNTIKDTIVNNPIWLVTNLDLDSIKAERGEHIHFIGFDTEPTSQPIKIIPKKKKRLKRKQKKSCNINDNTQSQFIPGGGSNGNSSPPSSKTQYLIIGLFLFSSILFFYYSRQEKLARKTN